MFFPLYKRVKNWSMNPRIFVQVINTNKLPSGKQTVSIEHGHRNSWFTLIYPLIAWVIFYSFPMKNGDFPSFSHEKWWFSIVFPWNILVYQAGYPTTISHFSRTSQSLRRATKGSAKEALTSSSILKEVTASCCLGGKTMGPVEETYNP